MTDRIKEQILGLVRDYHRDETAGDEFVPGTTPVLSSGPVLSADDRAALAQA